MDRVSAILVLEQDHSSRTGIDYHCIGFHFSHDRSFARATFQYSLRRWLARWQASCTSEQLEVKSSRSLRPREASLVELARDGVPVVTEWWETVQRIELNMPGHLPRADFESQVKWRSIREASLSCICKQFIGSMETLLLEGSSATGIIGDQPERNGVCRVQAPKPRPAVVLRSQPQCRPIATFKNASHKCQTCC